MIYIGVDNGSSGGIAAIEEDGSVIRAVNMPPTDVEILICLSVIVNGNPAGSRAVLEHAQSFPKMGVTSAFNYGKGYGAVQMALSAAMIRFDIVVPRKWQAALSCLSGGDKNVTKRRAEQLFPDVKVTHAIADALLIAEYCRRLHRGVNGKESEGRQTEGQAGQASKGQAEQGPGDKGRGDAGADVAQEDSARRVAAVAGAPDAGRRPGPKRQAR